MNPNPSRKTELLDEVCIFSPHVSLQEDNGFCEIVRLDAKFSACGFAHVSWSRTQN